eukprot:CAMPEP_0173067752 /NCGR_PEP_ID=MMETSP1102-20130122/7006_1 /TAXON_ID=49646 /ORGANISM="Geminigera sp., Strain Caron Lab Isolate" /LENGTH=217 /DNA_ID=CAMNT_0013935485 /DNA_START=247 /DNA_END=900 /DNA_ORIENTATION=-
MPCPWDPVSHGTGIQLASSEVYPGCESDSGICMHSGYYSNGGEGHASTFVDPTGCNSTYQSCPAAVANETALAGTQLAGVGNDMPTVSLEIDPTADDFVWQRGYEWCLTTPDAASGCAVYNAQAGGEELAVLPPPSYSSVDNVQACSRANPGHLLLCGHAMLLGAAMATQEILCGNADIVFWKRSFEDKSGAAAEAMTPIGGYVLKHLVFKTSEPIA